MTVSRRTLLTAYAGSCLPLLSGRLAIAQGPYGDPAGMDAWMTKWMASLGAASGALHLGRFADRMYFLLKDISWSPNPGQEAYRPVKVPPGFVTDLASIPRVFWSLLPSDGNYTYPAILHDYLYWEQPVSREAADQIFKFSMQDFKISSTVIDAIYAGVRAGGSAAWNDNRDRRNKGEKRVLKVYPSDPTTTWVTYRQDSRVFR